MDKKIYSHRFLARFIIEAKTPLAVGSGEKDMITDALVATDVNGLPYIPATSIAGVLRSMVEIAKPDTDGNGTTLAERIFGFRENKEQRTCRKNNPRNSKEEKEKDDVSKGSDIIFTDAKVLNSEGLVIDGLNMDAIKKDSLLSAYKELPIRQHVRINEKGTAADNGKFDEQVVFTGTRFCFEIEMVSDGNNVDDFEMVLEQLKRKSFRIGGGTRCGFGEIAIFDVQKRTLDLSKSDDLTAYLKKSSALDLTLDSDFWSKILPKENKGEKEEEGKEKTKQEEWTEYKLTITPDSFFLFGSGFGDEDADMTPVKEQKVDWTGGKGKIEEYFYLLPATSIKGAIAHRVAYHYNKLTNIFAEDFINAKNVEGKEMKDYVGSNNEAVRLLFGSVGENDEETLRGNVILSDLYVAPKEVKEKILNHVAIDRFTGGAIDGALFSEKTTYSKDHAFEMTILVAHKNVTNMAIQALEEAMKDICRGLLPLGGGVNRGNGMFTGSLTKDGDTIYENQ